MNRTNLIAIKGNKNRGKDVIKILTMLGGINKFKYDGKDETMIYFRTFDNTIIAYPIPNSNTYPFDIKPYTVDEFYNENPFSVGERVKSAYGNWYTKIVDIAEVDGRIGYRTANGGVDNYLATSESFEKCPQFDCDIESLKITKETLVKLKEKHIDNMAISVYNVIISEITEKIMKYES